MLPTDYSESVNGREITIPVNTDFRTWMKFERLITDSRIPEDKLVITALKLIFPKRLPCDISQAVIFMLEFYRCGREIPESSGTVMLESRLSYSFDHDFPMIAAAFMEKYGIDLWDIPYMHWWKFRALFSALHDCRFTEICSYRISDPYEESCEARREFIEQMQQAHALPVSVNELRRIEAQRRWLDG